MKSGFFIDYLKQLIGMFLPKSNYQKTSYINAHETLNLNSKTKDKIKQMESQTKKVIKEHYNKPAKILSLMSKSNVKIYKIKNANKIFGCFGEDIGFIMPENNIKAFFLNLVSELLAHKKLKLSFKKEMLLIIDSKEVDVYFIAHNYYKYIAYKSNLPGVDGYSQSKFKDILKKGNRKNFNEMSLDEILVIEEAIARDKEAIDFVITLSKEIAGSKQSLLKIQSGQAASI